ncbi:pyruvate decarboxylase [Auriscalpium vulgare]|uniref:Pyruvate decarboxylase n=1 Tax=Auriscalpium vulgare TaxID=40419 RepID=A0ACB8S475_9AGAM|nr:pyruvate decarboxylase [Auriscalpium vulgare]
MSSETVTVGAYLLERLRQLGVKSLFGVPGDFNLGFLDLVEDHPDIDWVGNCNELNAAYAADGYARVNKKSIGAILTTFGVGELSAINGIAGSFSEMVPIVHIAGVPSVSQQKNKPMLHHTLGDGRFDAYLKASQQFTISQADIKDNITAGSEIDRVLTDCITSARPVYIMLPTDIAYAKTSSAALSTPLKPTAPEVDTAVQGFVLDEIEKLVEAAGSEVIILVDACAIRHGVEEETWELIKRTGFPVYSAPMGKTAVPEGYEKYGGIYVGSLSHPEIKEKVESAKLILAVGSLKSDFNTGNFTYRIPQVSTVELHSDHTRVQYALYPNVGFKELLPKLTARLHPLESPSGAVSVPPFVANVPAPADDPLGADVISQLWFWPRLGKFFEPEDVIVTETGTSSFGALAIPLPRDSIYVSQILWGSIGYATGSMLGAALAQREIGLKGRTILFTGDGSLQLTVQELSTVMRKGLNPIIFVLNNSGYTIERHLHGRERKYNDIVNWKWTSLLDVLAPADLNPPPKSYTVHTKNELDALLKDESFAHAKGIQLVEVMMDKYDAPLALLRQAELSGKTNKYVGDYV